MIVNSIIAKNEAAFGPDFRFDEESVILTAESDYNLIGVWDEITTPGDHSVWGTSSIPLDPLLRAVHGSDGTLYYQPHQAGAAVDAGSNALAVDRNGNPLETDVLGKPRIHNGIVDIGAVEVSNTPELIVGAMPRLNFIEGQSAIVDVTLTVPPTAPISVTIERLAGGSDDITFAPASLIFDATNWDVPQTVTVAAAEDDDRFNDTATLIFTAVGLIPISLPVTAIDKDFQTYVVNSLEDVVADDGVLTLREAIEAANTNAVAGDAPGGCEGMPDVITFDATLAGGTVVLTGGHLELLDNVIIVGLGHDRLTIDANGLGRVFRVASGVTATIDGLTLTGGLASDAGSGDSHDRSGGAVYLAPYASASVTNSALVANSAHDGGAIYGDFGSSLTIAASIIQGNTATQDGGGLFNRKGVMVLTDVTAVGNVACSGGGILNSGSLTVVNSSIEANSASDKGGGICSTIATTTLHLTTLADNVATRGGGVYNQESTLFVTDSIFEWNSATADGAGICNDMPLGVVTVTDSTFLRNKAKQGGGLSNNGTNGVVSISRTTLLGNTAVYGGALWNDGWNNTVTMHDSMLRENSADFGGAVWSDYDLVVTDSVISDNVAMHDGGGVFLDYSGYLNLAGSIVENNIAAGDGGGIRVGQRRLVVTDSRISGNRACGDGGGIYTHRGVVHLENVVVSDNACVGLGGGIYHDGSGQTSSAVQTIISSTILGNSAREGGGIYCFSDRVAVISSTIARNVVTNGGGGIGFGVSDIHVICSTIAENVADQGGGIFSADNLGNLKIVNSLIALNQAAESNMDVLLDGTLNETESDYNLFGIWDEQANPGTNSLWGTPASPLDPMVVGASNAAGTWFYLPEIGSPVINSGNDAMAVDYAGNPISADVLGNPRIAGAAIEIGAIELSETPELIVLSQPHITLNEGENVSIGVRLSAPLVDPILVTAEMTHGGVSFSTLLFFDPSNWNVPQGILVTGAEDDNRTNETAELAFSAVGMDSITVSILVIDNDAQTYVVNSLEDVIADDGFLTLREALEAANTNRAVGDAPAGCEGAPDVITFAPELFTDGVNTVPGTIVLTGHQLEILEGVKIVGPGADLLTIDGDGLSRVFFVAPQASVMIDGLTISGGLAQDVHLDDDSDGKGGGIYLSVFADLMLTDAVVQANSATDGGGIYNSSGAVVALVRSTIALNSASQNGGGIHNGMLGTISVKESVLQENSAVDSGGGIFNNNYGSVAITDSTIRENDAGWGGGICTNDYSSLTVINSVLAQNVATTEGGAIFSYSGDYIKTSVVVITDSILHHNTAGSKGGGISNNGLTTLSNATLHDNSATSNGGGIYNTDTLHVTQGSLFSNNSAGYGGGVFNSCTGEVHITTNSRIQGNTATQGGGIYNYERGRLHLTDAVIEDNDAQKGGGIYNGRGSHLTMTDAFVVANSATSGGGIYNDCGLIICTDSTIEGNSAGMGGGVYNYNGASLWSTGSLFSENHATGNGGAVYTSGNSSANLADSSFTANRSNGFGGAIHNELNATTNVTNSLFSGNTTVNRGGAIYNLGTLSIADSTFIGNVGTATGSFGGAVSNYNGATAQISGSAFHGNVSGYGAGVFGYQNTTVVVANSVFSGNVARTWGGGLFNYGYAVLAVVNTTVAANVAARGGGIYNHANCQLTLQNSIVAMNTAPVSPDIFGNLEPDSIHNQVGGEPRFVRDPDDGGDGWHDDPATLDFDESTNNDYGDLRLRFDSPAINAGSNALAVDTDGNALTVDVVGQPRIVYDFVDLGAHEFQAVTLLGDANGDNAVNELDAAILASNWGKSGMTWADGDFNNDGRVNAIDAAILAAHFGTTFTPPAGEATAAAATKTPSTAAAPLVGPLPDGDAFLFRQPIEPARRMTVAETPAGAADAMRLGMRLVAPMETMPSDQQGTYALRSPEELLIETTAELSAAALDTALAEEYGAAIEPTSLLNGHAGWSRMVARRQSNRRDTGDLGRAELAVDLLMAGR